MKACHCSLNCFLKPPLSNHSACPLKLEDVKHVSCNPSLVSIVLEKKSSAGDVVEVGKNGLMDDGKVAVAPKSSLRKKTGGCDAKGVKKRRVEWMDFAGKELAEIREFEPLESGGAEERADSNSAFMCVVQ